MPHRSKGEFGDWFRRLRSKLGTKAATTGAAHKLAWVLYAVVKHRRPYDRSRRGNPDVRRARNERSLRRQAEALGFGLMRSPGKFHKSNLDETTNKVSNQPKMDGFSPSSPCPLFIPRPTVTRWPRGSKRKFLL